MPTRKHIFQLLSSNGDGTGTTNAIGDYSSTPLSLRLQLNEPELVKIRRMIVKVQDDGTFDAELYGNGITLTNGIRMYHRNKTNDILEEITAFPIKSTGDWAGHCYDVNHFTFGTGDEIISVRWTFANSGLDLIVNFAEGEYIEILLNDDFTGLVEHKFQVQGYYNDQNL